MPRWTIEQLNEWHARKRQAKAALPKPPPLSRTKSSKLEAKFEQWWGIVKGPPLVKEHRFTRPRRWRFDYAEVNAKIAIEIEGGVWVGGRHNRGVGFIKDAEKYNEAEFLGWSIIRLVETTITVENCQRIKQLILKKLAELQNQQM